MLIKTDSMERWGRGGRGLGSGERVKPRAGVQHGRDPGSRKCEWGVQGGGGEEDGARGTGALAAASGTMVPGHVEGSGVPGAGILNPTGALVVWKDPVQLDGLSS